MEMRDALPKRRVWVRWVPSPVLANSKFIMWRMIRLLHFFAKERTRMTIFQTTSGFARSPSPGIWPLPFLMM